MSRSKRCSGKADAADAHEFETWRRHEREPDPASLTARRAEFAAADLPHRRTLGYTAFEQRALDLARLILDMHRNGAQPSWMTAMDLAESAEGPFEGPYLLARVTALVRALLIERDAPYAYMSAGCMVVSLDEQQLMRVIHLARTGPFAELKAAAQELAGRDHVCRLLASAASLVQPDGVRRAASEPPGSEAPGESEDGAEKRSARLH
ncbi:MAG: hypothetical protein ACKVP4_13965 [Hyphomicrobium sp.]